MTWFWTTLLTLVLTYLLLRAWLWSSKNKKQPPGPKGFPIIGSLLALGKFPHRDLRRLSEKYGPIMHMKLGHVHTIIVSSPQAAELFLKTHDLAFAGRPPCQAAEHISHDQKNLAMGQYGPYWRNMRKMCNLELLSNRKIASFKPMRSEEVGLLVAAVKEAAGDLAAVDLSARVFDTSVDMSCRMVFGKKYAEGDLDEKGFKYTTSEGMHLMAIPNLGDYIPYVGALDLQGLVRRMKKVGRIFDAFLEKIINEHLQVVKEEKDDGDDDHEKHTKDFIDVMLGLMGSRENEYCIERSNIKAIVLDMLIASSDTSATSIEWTLSELIRHPKAMKKLQNEIQKTIGMERTVEESDLEHLEFLDMVIKESMRLHPVAPLLIPHESIEHCTVQGFDIPKGSRVMINIWAIGQDPRVWTDPKKFWPERFEGGNDVDIRGTDFRHIPFGAGRRGCPGIQLALTVVRLVVAQLVHCFDWELPEGMSPEELDMTEEFGLSCPRAKHLVAIPTYRLKNNNVF